MNERSEDAEGGNAPRDLGPKVEAYRDKLREAAKFQEADDNGRAGKAKSDAEELWVEIQVGMTPMLARHARAQFRKSDPNFEDFVSELLLVVYKQVSNLDEKKDIWQRVFNYCLERQAVKLAMRMKERLGPAMGSLNEVPKAANGEPGTEAIDLLSDPDWEMDTLYSDATSVLKWIGDQLTPNHLRVVQLRMQTDLTWPEIAERCEISEKTARAYHAAVKELFEQQNELEKGVTA